MPIRIALLLLLSSFAAAAQDRFERAKFLFFSGRRAEAIADADWLLEHRPEGVNLNEVDELRRVLDKLD